MNPPKQDAVSQDPGPNTRVLHPGGREPGPVSTPIVHSATFSFPTLAAMEAERDRGAAGSFYQRNGHPTLLGCERRLAALEGAESALLFSSGMAAISGAFLATVRSGDTVIALRQCYGGTSDLLRWGAERMGWSVIEVDARQPSDWERAFRPGTRLFHVETPTNPTLCVNDLEHAAAIAHRHGAILTVDNTIASPVGQQPLSLGADLALYSATKLIGGHSDLLAGAVIGSAQALEPVYRVRTRFGGMPDPSTAWLVERSLKTLPLRAERAAANALDLARRLAAHPRVARVFYPGLDTHPGHDVARRQMTLGFGPLMSFDVRGGAAAAVRVAEAFRVILHAPSLGGVESLCSLPAHTSHRHMTEDERSSVGIPPGLVRLSVGIEDVQDLWNDLDQALGRAGEA